LFAALAKGESRIEHFLTAGVTHAMLEALTGLGVPWDLQGDVLVVHSGGLSAWQVPTQPLNCGNSATSLRLLAGALATSGLPAVLDGTPGLRRRPMERILQPLRQMGVPIQAAAGSTAPLTLQRRSPDQPLLPLQYHLPVASAQVKSCLLLAGLAARESTTLFEPGPSRDHTERMLRTMGVHVESSSEHGKYITHLFPPGSLHLSPLNIALPGDLSAASFLIVAALITPGSDIKLCNVGLNPTRTGLLEALQRMGAEIEITPQPNQGTEPIGDLIVRFSKLEGTDISGEQVVRMIDEFPAFAIAAAFANGESTVRQAEELRYKESDRIEALVYELNRLGIQASEDADGFRIHGGRLPSGGEVDAHGDHRLAMALALAGLAGQGAITVTGAHLFAESFPEFPQVLSGLGAEVSVEPEI
jgi:3-phosphoshikimate 1-carboxyvinyltransferase